MRRRACCHLNSCCEKLQLDSRDISIIGIGQGLEKEADETNT